VTKTKLRSIAKSIPITGYMSYREWLAAVFKEAKSQDESYSYAKYSTDLAVGSSNAHSIITGKRNLTPKTMGHIIDALAMTGIGKKYLEALVTYERATDSANRDQAFAELMRQKTRALSTDLDRNQLRFFEHWYHAAILELLRLPAANDDPEWIASTLNPQPHLTEVKKALALLEELKYIAHMDGRLRPTDAIISTGDEASGIALSSFHQQMIEIAKRAVTDSPAIEREISSLTLSVPRGMRDQIKSEIVAFRKRILHLSQSTQDAEEVIQVNFQLFSLGRTDGDET
jgi:uncharacterized protein (TIGR02147 family)